MSHANNRRQSLTKTTHSSYVVSAVYIFIPSQCISRAELHKPFPIRQSRHSSGINKSAGVFSLLDNVPNAYLGQHAFRNVKYEKLKNNYDVLWLFLWRPARDIETRDNLLTAGQKLMVWIEYYEDNILQLQIENYTSSTRLWLSYFICDNKHTFVKQMSPDLAMLLVFYIFETVDWLDKSAVQ